MFKNLKYQFPKALRKNTLVKEKITKMAPGKSSRISKFASQNLISITYFTNFFRCKESFLLFVACRIRNICLTTTTPNFLKFPLLKQRKEMKKSYQDFFLSTPYVIFADWLCVTKVS